MAENKDKIENLTEEYKYSGDGKLMNDISSSEPLEKSENKKKKNKKIEVELKEESPKIEKIIETKEPTMKDVYIDMVKENKPFILKVNGTVIFDSEQKSIMILSFQDDCFYVGTDKHTYTGLNFKFKK